MRTSSSPRPTNVARWCRVVSLLLLSVSVQRCASQQEAPQCSIDAASYQVTSDPNLHEMQYDVGDGPQTTLVYVEPDVTTFYKGTTAPPPATTKVKPKFNGLSGKFINMSNKPVSLYW
jgi:hypothetical protein